MFFLHRKHEKLLHDHFMSKLKTKNVKDIKQKDGFKKHGKLGKWHSRLKNWAQQSAPIILALGRRRQVDFFPGIF